MNTKKFLVLLVCAFIFFAENLSYADTIIVPAPYYDDINYYRQNYSAHDKSSDCFHFVQAVLRDEGRTLPGGSVVNNKPYFSGLTAYDSCWSSSGLTNNADLRETLKKKFFNAKIGDVVQMYWNTGGGYSSTQHTAIIAEVTDDGVYFLQSGFQQKELYRKNADNQYIQGYIGRNFFSWETLARCYANAGANGGVSFYRFPGPPVNGFDLGQCLQVIPMPAKVNTHYYGETVFDCWSVRSEMVTWTLTSGTLPDGCTISNVRWECVKDSAIGYLVFDFTPSRAGKYVFTFTGNSLDWVHDRLLYYEFIVEEAPQPDNNAPRRDSNGNVTFERSKTDSNFWTELLNKFNSFHLFSSKYDSDELVFTPEMIAQIKEFNLSGKSISSLVGINYFTALEKLNCSGNNLTTLNVTGCKNLIELNCSGNNLTNLNVNGCTKLETIGCNFNQITGVLDVSGCTNLKTFYCSFNELQWLNMSGCVNLEYLDCSNNNFESLSVRDYPKLKTLYYGSPNLKTLNVINCTALTELIGEFSNLTTLNLSGCSSLAEFLLTSYPSVEKLDISGTAISGIGTYYLYDFPNLKEFTACNCPNLTYIDLSYKNLTRIDVSGSTNIEYLNCQGCSQLKKLLVENCSELTYIYAENNNLTYLDVSKCPKIEYIRCDSDKTQIICADGYIPIDYVHFPDANFRDCILDDVAGNCLLNTNMYNLTNINVSSRDIADLTGIEYLTELQALTCHENKLTKLDLSKNPKLKWLDCAVNSITELNITDCNALTYINCAGNQITKLNLDNCPELVDLNCDMNLLTSLNVSTCRYLKWLHCHDNNIASLNLANNSALKNLDCSHNQLASLNLNNCPELEDLSCSGNKLTQLDLSSCKNLTELYCYDNSLTRLDLSNLTKLTLLYCHDCQIEELRLDNCSSLEGIYCGGNKLTRLDVSKCSFLVYLLCDNDKVEIICAAGDLPIDYIHFPDKSFRDRIISHYHNSGHIIRKADVDVTKITELYLSYYDIEDLTGIEYFSGLKTLYADNNKLTKLDLSKNKALTQISCNHNQITEINLASCTELVKVEFFNNPLTRLDLSTLTKLADLDIGNVDKLTYLNVSNTALRNLICTNSSLTELRVNNCSKLVFLECTGNKLTQIYAVNCPNLTDSAIYCDPGVKIIRDSSSPVKIVTNNITNAQINKSYSFQLKASGTGTITWKIKSGSLPEGLNLSESGLISGKPSKAGNYKFTVTASNGNESDSKEFTIIVTASGTSLEITTETLKAGTHGKNYSSTVKAKGAKSFTASGLPEGLNISATGKISGKPSEYGNFNVIITASNANESTQKSFSLIIKPVAPKISAKISTGRVYEEYSTVLTISKGSNPVKWSVDYLPEGLTLNSETGKISGKPTQFFKGKINVTASNDAGIANKSMTLKIDADKPAITSITHDGRSAAVKGQSYSLTCTGTGTKPLTWSFTGLPEGMTGDSSTGKISGTPAESGKFKISVELTNMTGKIKRKKYTLTVYNPPAITTENLPDATYNNSYKFSLTATGDKKIQWRAEGLPTGLKISSSGKISGKPTAKPGNYAITITAYNAKIPDSYSQRETSKIFNLVINNNPDSKKAYNETQTQDSNDSTSASDSLNEPEKIIVSPEKLIIGPERNISTTNINLSNDYIIAAVLPEIHVTESGLYELEVELDENINIGEKLIWLAMPQNSEPSEDDLIAEFYDETGQEIFAVPENHLITISAWFNKGTIYAPIIAVK